MLVNSCQKFFYSVYAVLLEVNLGGGIVDWNVRI